MALVISSVIIGCGLFYSLILGDVIRFRDEEHYLSIAQSLVSRLEFSEFGQPTAFHPLGYPLLLAVSLKLGANIFFLRLLNFIFLAVCSYLLYLILLKRANLSYGSVIAPLLVLCYPVLFYTAGTLYPQMVSSALFLFILFQLTNSEQRQFFLNGTLTGFLILIAPTFLCYVPILAGLPLLFGKKPFTMKILVFLVGVILVVGCWTLRNYIVFHRFVLLSTNMGITLLLGNSENASPNIGVSADISKYSKEVEKYQLDEVDADRYYRSKALEWVFNNPGRAVGLYFQKFINYFNFYNELATSNVEAMWKNVIMFFTYYPLLFLMLIRIALFQKFPMTKIELTFIVIYFFSAFMNAFFLARIRYRLSFDFLMIAVAAAFLGQILKAWIGNGKETNLPCGNNGGKLK
ncbi:MAG: hypothetical protein NTX75_04725 [Proteobacteria bacterium]|nr:hypothetical protein [Pseudomonadota bacterium]